MPKRAIITFDSALVAERLGLPPGVSIVSTNCEHRRAGISFLIEGDSVPVNETESGCRYPELDLMELIGNG